MRAASSETAPLLEGKRGPIGPLCFACRPQICVRLGPCHPGPARPRLRSRYDKPPHRRGLEGPDGAANTPGLWSRGILSWQGRNETGKHIFGKSFRPVYRLPPIPDGRHYSACVGVAEGVGLQELVTPPAVAIGPNGESLHTAQRATRVKPARIRDPGAVAVGKGNYTGTTLKTPRERPAGQAQPPQQV